jgi:hypothetical protein
VTQMFYFTFNGILCDILLQFIFPSGSVRVVDYVSNNDATPSTNIVAHIFTHSLQFSKLNLGDNLCMYVISIDQACSPDQSQRTSTYRWSLRGNVLRASFQLVQQISPCRCDALLKVWMRRGNLFLEVYEPRGERS